MYPPDIEQHAPALEIRDLRTYFTVRQNVVDRIRAGPRIIRAVDGVSLSVQRGETVGLVGESGCGKSTLGRSVLRLVEPTSGEIRIDGTDVVGASGANLRNLRRRAQIIFQDPSSSLNPRMTVAQTLEEPMAIFNLVDRPERRKRVIELLEQVGLPADAADRYPHQFSGGQRQRIGIAAALALDPALIVADEPTSALDVSVQAQVLNLLEKLRKSLGLAYLFISHNLDVVRHLSDRVAVMYLGKIVEMAPTEELFSRPLHPYTQALISAIPDPDPDTVRAQVLLEGEVPSPLSPPAGCRFHPRCPIAGPTCSIDEPKMATGIKETHYVACHAVAWSRAHADREGLVPDPTRWLSPLLMTEGTKESGNNDVRT